MKLFTLLLSALFMCTTLTLQAQITWADDMQESACITEADGAGVYTETINSIQYVKVCGVNTLITVTSLTGQVIGGFLTSGPTPSSGDEATIESIDNGDGTESFSIEVGAFQCFFIITSGGVTDIEIFVEGTLAIDASDLLVTSDDKHVFVSWEVYSGLAGDMMTIEGANKDLTRFTTLQEVSYEGDRPYSIKIPWSEILRSNVTYLRSTSSDGSSDFVSIPGLEDFVPRHIGNEIIIPGLADTDQTNVMDTSGKLVSTGIGDRIDVSTLRSDMYIVCVESLGISEKIWIH